MTEWLRDREHADTIRPAQVIASELVNNVLAHTASVPVLQVETDGAAITIAVSDHSRRPPTLIELASAPFRLSGLHVVSALADARGMYPAWKARRYGRRSSRPINSVLYPKHCIVKSPLPRKLRHILTPAVSCVVC